MDAGPLPGTVLPQPCQAVLCMRGQKPLQWPQRGFFDTVQSTAAGKLTDSPPMPTAHRSAIPPNLSSQ